MTVMMMTTLRHATPCVRLCAVFHVYEGGAPVRSKKAQPHAPMLLQVASPAGGVRLSAARPRAPRRRVACGARASSHAEQPPLTPACDLLDGARAAECWKGAVEVTLPGTRAHERCGPACPPGARARARAHFTAFALTPLGHRPPRAAAHPPAPRAFAGMPPALARALAGPAFALSLAASLTPH
jgi:hypothetical protein